MHLDLTTLVDDRSSLVREIPDAAVGASAEDFSVDGALRLEADLVRKDAGEFQIAGRITGALHVPCSRCLEPFVWPLSTAFDLQYLPASAMGSDNEAELGDDELGVEFYRDDTIDLGILAREQCYLALPMKPLCRPDCRGLCPQCGVNLNQATCDCDAQWVDPRLAGLKALLPGREPE
jgi:uncharacterized protein